MLEASVLMISNAHKTFHRSAYWTSRDATINKTYLLCFLYVAMTAVTLNSVQLYAVLTRFHPTTPLPIYTILVNFNRAFHIIIFCYFQSIYSFSGFERQ